MVDGPTDPVAERRAEKAAMIPDRPVTEATGEAAPPAPGEASGEQPRDEKGRYVPKSRLDEVIQQRNEARSRAELWDQLIADPSAVELLSGHFNAGTGSPPPTAQPPAPVAGMDPLMGEADPQAQMIAAQQQQIASLQQQVQRVGGAVGPMLDVVVSHQKAAVRKEWPDFDPDVPENTTALQTLIATGRAKSILDAARILRAERGAHMPPPPAQAQAAAEVQVPKDLRDYGQALENDLTEAKKDWRESGGTNQEAFKAMVSINSKKQELKARLANLGATT
jgi:hypothetical protein